MAVFERRTPPPPKETSYPKYRPHVRDDFQECCAYCLLHERLAGGEENYELDHFRPKSNPDFRAEADDYYNLYYSCHVCNRTKWSRWPSQEQLSSGFRFVDYCSEVFSEHFEESDDGEWVPLTPAGQYTSERLRLNRGHLKTIRYLMQSLASKKGIDLIDWDRPIKGLVQELLPGP